MATITRIGFGQVEPNHMSYKRTGQIYAQYPAAADIEILENGQFLKYDGVKNEANTTTKVGEWLMVYNEIKLYDEREQMYRDFAMIKTNFTPGSNVTHEGWGPYAGQMTPRLVKLNVGDIFTTNTLVKGNTSNKAVIEDDTTDYNVGDFLTINENGFLQKADEGEFQIIASFGGRTTTLPDGQLAVKVQKIK